jgi:hypothetical protein
MVTVSGPISSGKIVYGSHFLANPEAMEQS